MAEGGIKLKKITNVIANGVTATNILTVREDHVMNITGQFTPNTFQGLGFLQKAKWRNLTFTIDTETNAFDASFGVTAANSTIGTSLIVTFAVADATGTAETWTYQIAKSYVSRREFGRIEDGATRNTYEYTILTYGTRLIA